VHLRHVQDPSNAARQWGGYYALAQHFGAALGRVFGDPDKGHPRVIILEDDLEIAVRRGSRCSRPWWQWRWKPPQQQPLR
jgi:hypothetical protein